MNSATQLFHCCRLVLLGAALHAAPIHAQPNPGPVYLAYAGPHSSSPASAFGHLFLVLAETDQTPLPLWDVVSFAADTENAGAFRFFARGILGGFSGSYERLTFHEKSRDYESLDDRDLWLLELKISSDERANLIQAISATQDRVYPYTFFVQNCAYYLQALLAQAGLAVPHPSGPTSPTGVWRLLEDVGIGGATHFRPGISRRLQMRFAGSNESGLERLRREPWERVVADTAWVATLTPDARAMMSEFVAWRLLHRQVLLPDRTAAGISALRLRIANDLVSDIPRAVVAGREDVIGVPTPAPNFHGYLRLSAGVATRETGDRVHLRVRPALHGLADPWTGHRPVNALEFLTFEASADARTGSLRMEELVLFSQRSLTAQSWITRTPSWMLEARLERGGILGSGLQTALRGGAGTAAAGRGFHAYALLTTGLSSSTEVTAPTIGFETGLLVLAGQRWRAGVGWAHERKAFDLKHSGFSRSELWARRDIGRNLGVRAETRWISEQAEFVLMADWYPR